MKQSITVLFVLVLAVYGMAGAFAQSESDFDVRTWDGRIVITKYTGSATAVVIPATIGGKPVSYIDEGTFLGYTRLTSISIPASVFNIMVFAFRGCTNLTSISIGANVTVATSDAGDTFENGFQGFYNRNGRKAGVYTWSGSAWSYTAVAQTAPSPTPIQPARIERQSGDFTVSIADGKVTITKYTGNAIAVVIPATIEGLPVTVIGESAFFNCKDLAAISIPASVTSIGGTAFANCTSMTGISVDERNASYTSRDDVLFNKKGDTLVTYPAGKKERQYVIPAGVTSIELGAFWGCTALTSVSIPASVKSIGDDAFLRCTGLTSVSIPASVTRIGSVTFEGCTGLISVNIPASVTDIGTLAFDGCRNLTTVSIGANVKLRVFGWRDTFDNDLDAFYDTNGKKAGMYTFHNGTWSYSVR